MRKLYSEVQLMLRYINRQKNNVLQYQNAVNSHVTTVPKSASTKDDYEHSGNQSSCRWLTGKVWLPVGVL